MWNKSSESEPFGPTSYLYGKVILTGRDVMDAVDELILRQYLEGNKAAFSELVKRYRGLVYGIGYHYLGDFTEAEDLAQDVFLQAYLKLHQLKSHASLAPWLRRIAINLCNRRLESHNRDTACLERLSMTPAKVAPNPEDICERKALHEQVVGALANLSEKNRLTFTLYYIDDLTCQQVAQALEVPVGTVKRRLHVSRKQLREEARMVFEDFEQNKLQVDFIDKVIKRFDELINLSQRDILRLLHLVGERDFLVALRNADPRVRNSILTNIEPIKREELDERIESIDKLPEEAITHAQQVVLDCVRLENWLSNMPTMSRKEQTTLFTTIAKTMEAIQEMEQSGKQNEEQERRQKAEKELLEEALLEAIKELTGSRDYMLLLDSVAEEFLGKGLTFHDLMQEGSLGLLLAFGNFDYHKGGEFGVYATQRIRKAIVVAIEQYGEHSSKTSNH